jgi:hypothetical protein
VTGDARSVSTEAASMTPALQKLRGYYGINPGEEGNGCGDGGRSQRQR